MLAAVAAAETADWLVNLAVLEAEVPEVTLTVSVQQQALRVIPAQLTRAVEAEALVHRGKATTTAVQAAAAS